MGISAKDCCFNDFFSNYKNIWMRYTYYRLSGDMGTLNTSCFAITHTAFFKSGGFDEFRRKDLEDAIYGDKLQKMGFTIVVDKNLEYIHKKKYALPLAVRTDIFRSRKLTEYNEEVSCLARLHIRQHYSKTNPSSVYQAARSTALTCYHDRTLICIRQSH